MVCGSRQKRRTSTNTAGANQHRARRIVDDIPDLAKVLQAYVDDGVRQEDIPKEIGSDHGVTMKLRTVQKYMKDLGVITKRRNGLTMAQKVQSIELISEEDRLGRWGNRYVQEKLGHNGIHIPRDEIMIIRRDLNPEGSAARHPRTRKTHHHGLWSIGPDEEWCVDGHEKLLNSMGIAVWGVIDKFSRMELGLWAMPNARIQELPPALFLRLVNEKGGMPLTVTSDKGSEVGLLISLVTTMRHKFQPFLSDDLPPFKAVKSVYNITRERSWRPLWEKELGNVLHEYKLGLNLVGYLENDLVHAAISRWVWGQIVQERLNNVLRENQTHRIRKQKGTLLPSGGRRIDMYLHPEDFSAHAANRLIPIPSETTTELLAEYDRPDLLLFGSPEEVELCEQIYVDIGSPKLSARLGWEIFGNMLECYLHTQSEGVANIG